MSSINIINSSANRNSENVAIWSHITSSLLHSWITETNTQRKLLIIDSRSHSDYDAMHITDAINVPYSKIVLRKLLNDKISISELLMKNSTSNHLIDEVNIVVYDKNTEHSNQLADQDTDAFAFILLTKIAHKFKSVSFLSGGFVDFHHNYPILCSITGPSTRHTSTAPTSPETTPSVSTEKLLTAMEPISAELNKRLKKHVLNHSISSYDTTSEFFRATSLNLAKSAYSTVLDTVPGHSSSEKEESPAAFSTPSSPAIREPTKILNYLFLGSQEDALSSATLKALGITNVLNVSINCPKPDFISDANFLRISVNDGHTAKIRPFFDVAFRFIEKCRKANTKVLIHCLAGISRSPTLAIAYLMRSLSLCSDDAYKFVKEKRPTISPNFNFLGQLYEYDKFLLKEQRSIREVSTEQEQSTTSAEAESPTRLRNKAAHSLLKFNTRLRSAANASLLGVISDHTHSAEADHPEATTPKQLFMTSMRRKQFIFPFSNSSNNPDENMCSPASSPAQLHLVQPATLASPSQAFSNFNLNSPTVNHKAITENNSTLSSISSCSLSKGKDLKQHSQLAKSFTTVGFDSKILSIHNQRPTELVMHRPTNLLMNSLTASRPDKTPEEPTKSLSSSLKRPSSIVFEAKKVANAPVASTADATSDYPFLVNPQKFNKVFSNHAASGQMGSPVCTCPLVSPTSLGAMRLVCSACSGSPHQQFQKKKIKLSPVQIDRAILNTFQMTQ